MLILPSDDEGIAEAARILAGGGLVAFPTETVYGLGARADCEAAIRSVYAAKGRPPDNPLIVHVAEFKDVGLIAREVSDRACRLARQFWPGPLTLVLPRAASVPPVVSAGLDTVAVRQPDHPVALRLIRAAGFPLAAPSANRSGRPSPTSAAHVAADLEGVIDAVLDGGPCRVGVESTVVSLEPPSVSILRAGGIGAEELAAALGEPVLLSSSHSVASPGTRHPHYRPVHCRIGIYADCIPEPSSREGLVVLDGMLNARSGMAASENWGLYRAFENISEFARGLYATLREADALRLDVLHLPWPPPDGIGAALRDRIERAAREHGQSSDG